jgi:hypothetical protein
MDDTVRVPIFFEIIQKAGPVFLFGSDLFLRDIMPVRIFISTGRECLLFDHARRKTGRQSP